MEPSSKFKIVPNENELNAMERDLRFHPVEEKSKSVLTREQIEQFNQLGHIGPFQLFSNSEVDDLRNYFDRLLEIELAAGRDSYSISSAHCRLGRVYDLLKDQRLVEYVSDLLGDDVIGWGSHFFCKLPKDGKHVDWHQDASYWPLSPSKAVTIWLAIDDATVENGCMKFVSGSHHFGHLTYRPSDSDGHNVLDQTIDNPEQFGTPTYNPMPAGFFSIHSDLLLHGSEANDSSRRRCALTLRYCAAEVRAGLDWNQKGVWVAGEDASQHWHNRTRPANE